MLSDIPHDLLEALLDNPYEMLILIDKDGIIRFMSSANEGYYSIPVKDVIGKHIREVSPKSRLTRVLKTGKAEIGRSMILNRKNRVISRLPIIKDGKVIGVAGKLMFRSPEVLKKLYDRIESLETKIDYYKDALKNVCSGRYSFDSIVGITEPLQKAKDAARQAAKSDATVLITGESGTGKELFAHAIHQSSRRSRQNFVRVNCASIPAELIESELFGYEPGSFTGARKQGKAGKFELAHNGTIFLDEIGDMPLTLQVKMMRVLQEREVERLGSDTPKPINFRVISATNRNLKKMLENKDFRLDLYYRLNVFHIHLPALREIREDIPAIFSHVIGELSIGKSQVVPGVSDAAIETLMNYGWPGNVRELRNVAERALIVCKGDRIEVKDLPIEKATSIRPPQLQLPIGAVGSLKRLMEDTEKQAILQSLQQTDNNRAEAAKLLGIHRTWLYQKMKKYRIS
jgi:transcriptional regulator with PAS, ATPase and Fis domain